MTTLNKPKSPLKGLDNPLGACPPEFDAELRTEWRKLKKCFPDLKISDRPIATFWCQLTVLSRASFNAARGDDHPEEKAARSSGFTSYMQTLGHLRQLAKEMGGSPVQRAKYGEEGVVDNRMEDLIKDL